MPRVRAFLLAGACAAFLAFVFVTGGAEARIEATSEYTKTQTYRGALRYLRVDLGYEITEKDPDAAYLLFEYRVPGRKDPSRGSIEIVEGRDEVTVLIQVPAMPRYHEQVLTDGLLKKLRLEYGEPPRRKKRDKDAPKKSADAGADA